VECNAGLALVSTPNHGMAENAKPPNGAAAILSTLAQSANKWVQLGTLAMVALSGIGNWLATWRSASENRHEIEKGQERVKAELVRQVEQMHTWMAEAADEFHKGNADSAANRKMLNELVKEDLDTFERRQQASLNNQNQIIQEIHDIVEKLEQWSKAKEHKGAP
jgi:hypothetical protein